MGRIKIHKLRAASMLEVLVSITIITTVMAIGSLVFLNVTSSSYSFEKVNASLLLNQLADEIKAEKSLFDEDILRDPLVVKKSIVKYPNSDSLYILDLKAYNSQQKLLAERKEIIFVKK